MAQFQDSQWDRIARSIPGRSMGDCQWQYRKLTATSRQAWTNEEDEKLLSLASQNLDVRFSLTCATLPEALQGRSIPPALLTPCQPTGQA